MSSIFNAKGEELNISMDAVLRSKTIGFLGDSITWGTGASDSPEARSPQSTEKAYAPLLSKHFKNSVIAGYPGYTIDQIIANIDAIPTDRDYIVFFGGTNGIGASLESFTASCDNAFSVLRTKFPDKKIIAVTPYILPGQDPANEIQRIDAMIASARKFSIPVCDLFSIVGFSGRVEESKSIFFADNVHPNDNGHRRIYETLLAFIERM